MLNVQNLQTPMLKPVSITLGPGICISIEGASGSGKTVLLRAIADLDSCSGLVAWDGRERGTMSGPEWRSKVRYVASEPGYWADIVADHFSDVNLAQTMFDALDLPHGVINRTVERLSSGEKQRIGISLALADNPPVILADEPTSALDGRAAGLVENLLRKRLEDGASIILVSHDPELAGRLADRHFVISDGELQERAS